MLEKKYLTHTKSEFASNYLQNRFTRFEVKEKKLIASVPKNCLVELTNACNHACVFCKNPEMKRKIAHLEKNGMIKKDKYKRYTSDDSKKILSMMDHNVKLLGIFFSQCLETYSIKH